MDTNSSLHAYLISVSSSRRSIMSITLLRAYLGLTSDPGYSLMYAGPRLHLIIQELMFFGLRGLLLWYVTYTHSER